MIKIWEKVETTEGLSTRFRLRLYQIAYFCSDVKNHLSVPFKNAIFRGIIATETDVVSPGFWKLYIPYRIGAFSRRHWKLSGLIVYKRSLRL
jgi:hypothetical protein